MSARVEEAWTALLSSNTFRHFAKRGIGAKLFRSEAYRQLNLGRRYVTSQYQRWKAPALFEHVRTYCLFIGHNKSGTSMLGSLLDAHPDVILTDEADALQYVPTGFSRDQIYHILLKGSRREAMKGRVTARRVSAYSFLVPHQWQGRYRTLRVIGDSTSGSSTGRLARDPGLLERLQAVMKGVDVKLIQVIRNPYDPISYMMVRGNRTFANAIEHYFASCEALVALRKRLDSSQLLSVKYEDFVRHPEINLTNICRFLEVEPQLDYIHACTSILDKVPHQHRSMVEWDDHWIKVVKNKIRHYDFLEGYTFES